MIQKAIVWFIKNMSIKRKVLITAFFIFSLTIFISDGVFLLTIYKTLTYRNYIRNRNIAGLLALNLEDLSYRMETGTLINIFNGIIQYGNVQYFIVYNDKDSAIKTVWGIKEKADKNLLSQKFHKYIQNHKNSEGSPIIIKNIYFKSKKIGKLAVKFKLRRELKNIKDRVFWVGVRFFCIAVIFVVLGMFIFYMFTVFLTKPLLEIKNNIEKIKNGNFKISFTGSSNDEIGEIINAISLMSKAIENYAVKIDKINKEKNEMNCLAVMGEMSANVAHEVKNAIYVISSANNYISKETRNKIVKEFTDIISKEVNRLNKMTIDFMSLSRQRNPEFEPVDVKKLIEYSLNILSHEMSGLGITLIKDLDRKIPPVKGDLELLKQVIMNLLVNAIESVGCLNISSKNSNNSIDNPIININAVENKIIGIKAESDRDFAFIEIRNNGQPISLENMEKIFKPFFTTKNSGSGLGLPISLRIVRLHGGNMEVRSDSALTIFTVKLPLLKEKT